MDDDDDGWGAGVRWWARVQGTVEVGDIAMSGFLRITSIRSVKKSNTKAKSTVVYIHAVTSRGYSTHPQKYSACSTRHAE